MNWLHAFRMGGGQMTEDQVNVVRTVMATHGYRTITEQWWINEVHRNEEVIYVRRRYGGDANTEDIHNDVLASLPGELISVLDSSFGEARAHGVDDEEQFEVIIDEWQGIRATPNVGAATVLPLPK